MHIHKPRHHIFARSIDKRMTLLYLFLKVPADDTINPLPLNKNTCIGDRLVPSAIYDSDPFSNECPDHYRKAQNMCEHYNSKQHPAKFVMTSGDYSHCAT